MNLPRILLLIFFAVLTQVSAAEHCLESLRIIHDQGIEVAVAPGIADLVPAGARITRLSDEVDFRRVYRVFNPATKTSTLIKTNQPEQIASDVAGFKFWEWLAREHPELKINTPKIISVSTKNRLGRLVLEDTPGKTFVSPDQSWSTFEARVLQCVRSQYSRAILITPAPTPSEPHRAFLEIDTKMLLPRVRLGLPIVRASLKIENVVITPGQQFLIFDPF